MGDQRSPHGRRRCPLDSFQTVYRQAPDQAGASGWRLADIPAGAQRPAKAVSGISATARMKAVTAAAPQWGMAAQLISAPAASAANHGAGAVRRDSINAAAGASSAAS